MYTRSCGERLKHRWSPRFEPVQCGPPGTLPQRGHRRGGAGGTDAAIRRRSQEGQTQAGRMARDSLWSIKDGTDGNVVGLLKKIKQSDRKINYVCVLSDAVNDSGSPFVQGETK